MKTFSTSVKLQKKGFVVEVQSHQQAMKSANPITDLEQTISRGMTDPYTDPRFVMNQINEEFFGNGLKNNMNAGTPIVENSLHNRELMAFQNLPMNPQGTIGMNSLGGNMFPSNPITQHAIKEHNVASSNPSESINQALSKLMQLQHQLGAKKNMEPVKLPSPYNLPKLSLDPRLPSNVNIAHVSTDVIHSSPGKQETGYSRSSTGGSISARDKPEESENIPDAVTAPSTTEISQDIGDNSQNLGDSSANIGDQLSSLIAQKGPKSNDILPSNPGAISGKEMEDNFSSIKAFIDADEGLRNKKVLDPVRNPLEDLMHKKHKKQTVPKVRSSLRKIIRSK